VRIVTVARAQAFWFIAAINTFFLFAAAAPSPLYGVYAAHWRFSAITLTEVFGVYAIALLITLLATGSLSDAVGRRPVIFAALAIQIVSMLAFLLASSVAWLFVARVVQGVATGLATSALSASFVDLQPRKRPALGPVVTSATPPLGLALGALASSVLVQYGPDPLHLVYWLLLAGFVVAAVLMVVVPEPTMERAPMRWLPRIGVEAAIRPAFVAALPSLIAGWAVGGFYLSLGPSLILQLAGSSNRILGGVAIALLAGVGSGSIVAFASWPPTRAMAVGGSSMLLGLAVTIASIALTIPAVFFLGTAITGVGFGVGWLGVVRSLVSRASATERGALLAAIFIVAYLSFAGPAVIAGFVANRVGLHDGALWYAGAVGILALAGLLGTVAAGRPRRVAVVSEVSET
jgi:MFS family permease